MNRKVRLIIAIVAAAVLIGAVGYILYSRSGYKKEAKVYDAISEYVVIKDKTEKKMDVGKTGDASKTGNLGKTDDNGKTEDGVDSETDDFPVEVDFEELKKINPDIIGWIYCPDTVINYPVLKGDDNDYYLHHNFKGDEVRSGSIFVECANRTDFVDSNTIVYGHYMKDGSMFACLSKWFDQVFYEEHPVMYLVTPEGKFILEIFSAYTTSADSDSYTAILTPCKELVSYLEKVAKKSRFKCDFEPDKKSRYVMLSTCAYSFENARTVLHAKLKPV